MTTDKIAIDTNILFYAFDNGDLSKQNVALQILTNKPFAAYQVIAEFLNCLLKKRK